MKREALLRELRMLARKNNIFFDIREAEGNGSHYRVYYGKYKTIIKSGELSPIYVKVIKKQLGL